MTTGKPSSRLLGIQTARGVAALLVVLYHTGRGIALPQYTGQIPFGGLFEFGHAGVDFFFVLSGFIIYFVHNADIGVPESLPRYLRRRLVRIYPIYWVVTALVVLLAMMRPGNEAPELGYIVRSLLLIPQRPDPILNVAWTLVFEMAFYVLFAMAILSRRLGIALVVIWLGLIIAGRFINHQAPLRHVLMSFSNLEFILGILAAHITLHHPSHRPLLLATVAAIAFAGFGLMENAGAMDAAGPVSELMFAAASVGLVIGLATAERQGRLHIGPGAAFLGNASYSLYLIHTIVIGLAARALGLLGLIKILPAAAIFGVVAAAAILAGAALHAFVELPLLRMLGTEKGRRDRHQPALPQ
jgi:peptidoglycan/LPS O-acetylase OafA/YrhL